MSIKGLERIIGLWDLRAPWNRVAGSMGRMLSPLHDEEEEEEGLLGSVIWGGEVSGMHNVEGDQMSRSSETVDISCALSS